MKETLKECNAKKESKEETVVGVKPSPRLKPPPVIVKKDVNQRVLLPTSHVNLIPVDELSEVMIQSHTSALGHSPCPFTPNKNPELPALKFDGESAAKSGRTPRRDPERISRTPITDPEKYQSLPSLNK